MLANIRSRMIILVLLSITPAVIFIFYLNSSENHSEERQQIENLKSVAKLYSAEHLQVVENAKHLLIALSAAPQVLSMNNAGCSNFLSSIQKKYKRYSNFGVANPKGNVLCSAVATSLTTNVSDTQFFKETVKNKDFSVGEYRISTLTGNAVLSFGYPLTSQNGSMSGIIYSSIDLSWLNQLAETLYNDEMIGILILDRNGVVLARNPDPDRWVGKEFPPGPLLKSLSSLPEGSVEDVGLDGTRRIYAFEKIVNEENAPFVVASIPKNNIFRETKMNLFQRLILSLTIVTISTVFAWWAGGILIVRQVEALKKIDTLKSDFVSLISHQIRTPLTSIRWFSEILLTQSKYRLPSKQRNIISDIHEVANEVISLVGTFLNISKIESGKIALSCEEVTIERLVRDAIKELKNPISKKKIKLDLIVSPKTLKAFFDQRLIKQVYLNLIGNAIKYSPAGGKVKVLIYKKDTNIVSEIKDKGIGIPTSEKNKIFQKFSRAKNASSFAPYGAGLGLYLVKLIIEAHRGKVWYKSAKRKGTSFFFSLPTNHEVL